MDVDGVPDQVPGHLYQTRDSSTPSVRVTSVNMKNLTSILLFITMVVAEEKKE